MHVQVRVFLRSVRWKWYFKSRLLQITILYLFIFWNVVFQLNEVIGKLLIAKTSEYSKWMRGPSTSSLTRNIMEKYFNRKGNTACFKNISFHNLYCNCLSHLNN